MGNKAIIRVAKHSTIGGLAASGQHNFRERETPNAEAERTPMNEIHGAIETADLLNRVSNLLPGLQKKTLKDGTEVVSKRRKDAVICIEYLITASPAHFGEWRESGNHGQDYFADSIAWLEKKHGKANVICTTVHLDESTPHLCAYVVPITKDGRLSAKEFVGGRKVLADLQTDFAERVGKKHNLERGELMSNAVHREPAHIASMTKERRRLEKQVKALEMEIERLTKSVSGGADALKKAQSDLIAAQAQVNQVTAKAQEAIKAAETKAESRKEHMGKLQMQSVDDMHEIHSLKTQIDDLNGKLTVSERKLGKMDVYTKDLEGKLIAANANAAAALRGKGAALKEAILAGEKSAELQKTVDMYEAQAAKLEQMAAKPLEVAQPVVDVAKLLETWQAEPVSEDRIRVGTSGSVKAVEGQYVIQGVGMGVHVMHKLADGFKTPSVGSSVTFKGGQVVDVRVQERGGIPGRG